MNKEIQIQTYEQAREVENKIITGGFATYDLIQWVCTEVMEETFLTTLLGVQSSQIKRWRKGKVTNPRKATVKKIQTVAAILLYLRGCYTTPEAVYKWFFRAHPLLGDCCPVDLLDEPINQKKLIIVAESLLDTSAT